MSKILKLINENYDYNDSFSAREFSELTGIDGKVCSMILKKLYNNFKIGGYIRSTGESFYFRFTDKARKKAIEEYNEMIEKYNLKMKLVKYDGND